MPDKLDDSEIDQILDAYDDAGTFKEASEKTGYALSTVRKYVLRHREDAGEGGDDDDESSVLDLSGDENSLVDLTDEELMEMDPAEFIETFFTEFDSMGVRDSFVQMISNQARLRQQVPDEDQMSQRLQSHNSGIGNANDANAIAELYWAMAERYLRARGLAAGGGMAAGAMGMGPGASGAGGDWVGAGQSGVSTQPQQNQEPSDDGEWVSTPNPGPMGRQAQGPRGQRQQPPGAQGNPQQQGGGSPQLASMLQQVFQQQQQMMNEMMNREQNDENEQLREEIETLKEQLADDDDDQSMTDSLKEVMELRELLSEFEDSDGDDQVEEVVGVLQQQLSQLQQEIRSDDNSGVNMGEVMAQGDSQFGLLAALAQNGDVAPSEVLEFAQDLGEVETHPEVAEKKYEKEIEKMRVNAEKEKWDSILQGAEEVVTSVSSVFAGGGLEPDEDDSAADEAQPEVTATAEEPTESADTGLSPAEEMVRQAGEVAQEQSSDPESDGVEVPVGDAESESSEPISPEPADVTPDTVDNPENSDEEADEVPAETDGGPSAVPLEESDEDGDQADELIVCPYCEKDDFDTKQQMWGHKGSCPEKED
jgi:hypothetical protein